MAEVIECPSCKRQLRLTEDLRGRQVQCPGCAATFMADDRAPAPRQGPGPCKPMGPLALEAGPVGPAGSVPDTAGAGPGQARAGPTPRDDRDYCPHCDEPVPVGAVACPCCGEFLDVEEEQEGERPWEREGAIRRDAEPHRGSLVLTLGILGVVVSPVAFCCDPLSIPFGVASVALGISSWVVGHGDLRKMNERVMDPEGRSQTQAGMVCGIIASCLGCLSLLGWGTILLLRLMRRL